MKAVVKAKGYTNIILVLNMKRFVAKQDQDRFESIRGTHQFASALRNGISQRVFDSHTFVTPDDEKHHRKIFDEMTTEEVGYATGIFRNNMLEDYTFPTYAVDKEAVKYPEELSSNYQFKNLFMRAWNQWRIFIRPSYTGLFVIRLTREYKKATHFEQIAYDVVKLQESLDVQSARNRLVTIRRKYANQPDKLMQQETSVIHFLDWLGTDEASPTRLLYAPVQWKVAMEVAKLFVNAIGNQIPLENQEPIQLISPDPNLSNPLHDSYIVYHFDEVVANREFVSSPVQGAQSDTSAVPASTSIRKKKIDLRPIRPQHIRVSHDLQQQFVSLAEGSLLRKGNGDLSPVDKDDAANGLEDLTKYFPRLEIDVARSLVEDDCATWQDELALFTPRTAIFMPSSISRNDELLIATLPSATSRFKYVRYWGAIERMVEFVLEVRVLTQLIERGTFNLLENLADTMEQTRQLLFDGDILLPRILSEQVSKAAQLRRLAALCQGLSDPHLWGRAEYAIKKAKNLIEQLGVPTLLTHIDRNINSINSVVDHVDELYIADLTEKNNDKTTLLSVVLAAASLILTILILPSFWADTYAVYDTYKGYGIVPPFSLTVAITGTFLASLLIGIAIWLISIAWRGRKEIIKILKKYPNG